MHFDLWLCQTRICCSIHPRSSSAGSITLQGMHMFEILQKAGLISRGKLNPRALVSLPFSQIIDIANTISIALNSRQARRVDSPYVHSASLDLGGAPAECESVHCRLDKVASLAQFAGLYSDSVTVDNFFADYASVAGHAPDRDSERFRERVAADITVALSMRPLIDAELIRLFSPAILQDAHHICMDCLANHLFGPHGSRRFRKVFDGLASKYLSSMSVEVYHQYDCYHLICELPEDLFEHGSIVFFGEWSDELLEIPKILSRIDHGEHVYLSKTSRQKIGIHHRVARIPIQSIIYHAAVTRTLGTSFLTHRKLDIDLLHAVGSDKATQLRNQTLYQNFQLLLPFAADVPVKQLLKLRQREEEAFIRFQAAISRTIAEIRSIEGEISNQDARNLYGDVIRPRLAELDLKVKEAKRDLVRYPAAALAGTMAVLGFGFFSGTLTTELQTMVAALGGYKAVHDLTTKTIDLADVRKSVRHDDMYFLWRARNLSRAAS